ncbi:TIGR00245 family protein [Beggiatoa alba B18LD]|uniref:TIGR00245 family protein n=1 Tax=Beggiatoa alba B18LD TaxID=395493 RepID=I3CHF4_9GAMM|nr:iron export ABC transporter permease subunit FetB [Beggiatoa alba]EIJ43047.1 TIGR00245 family protein [Beggiatoa alba B18LD]
MQTTIVAVGWLEIGLATLFICVAGIISVVMALGVAQSLIFAVVRTYAQLIALGFAFTWIFKHANMWIVLGILLCMIMMTTHIAIQRINKRPTGLFMPVTAAIFLSNITVTFTLTSLILQIDPWYDPRYVLTSAGMVLGNTMTSIAVSIERLLDDLRKRTAEVNQALAFGGTLWEVALPSIRTALLAGLMPMINSMNAVGLVFIPGMMTGQLLAGADPLQAARYQIVFILMLSAATAIGTMASVYLVYQRVFDKEWRLCL